MGFSGIINYTIESTKNSMSFRIYPASLRRWFGGVVYFREKGVKSRHQTLKVIGDF